MLKVTALESLRTTDVVLSVAVASSTACFLFCFCLFFVAHEGDEEVFGRTVKRLII